MNRLADATSPYLLQHADNPVDWYPWGEEAFAEARRRDVPSSSPSVTPPAIGVTWCVKCTSRFGGFSPAASGVRRSLGIRI
ncbi:uncharacterized protein YyaL (SSP411 family) [Catenulispora sp. GP43]